jgi:uncharacterized membrane protein
MQLGTQKKVIMHKQYDDIYFKLVKLIMLLCVPFNRLFYTLIDWYSYKLLNCLADVNANTRESDQLDHINICFYNTYIIRGMTHTTCLHDMMYKSQLGPYNCAMLFFVLFFVLYFHKSSGRSQCLAILCVPHAIQYAIAQTYNFCIYVPLVSGWPPFFFILFFHFIFQNHPT